MINNVISGCAYDKKGKNRHIFDLRINRYSDLVYTVFLRQLFHTIHCTICHRDIVKILNNTDTIWYKDTHKILEIHYVYKERI